MFFAVSFVPVQRFESVVLRQCQFPNFSISLIHNLVEQFTIFGDVDPNKVFIMGYSHGGYGAFAIGPKEPDLFAAIHSSAGAPTDGETVAKTLRTTIFTNMVGGLDTA